VRFPNPKLSLDRRDVDSFQEIDQESIVVRENVNAIRASLEVEAGAKASVAKTDRALGLRRG
jgi:hypothetical protein